MELLKRFKDRSPEYDGQYYDLILEFTLEQGGRMGTASEEDRWKQGKFFSTRYEMYMYAALLGMKRDYRIPIPTGTDKKKFIEIRSWQPSELADFIVMSLFGLSDIDLIQLEELEEKEIEKELSQMKTLLEEYANGGFDLIKSKKDDEPSFFYNDNCFIDLLSYK
jgi:hypothetical protein